MSKVYKYQKLRRNNSNDLIYYATLFALTQIGWLLIYYSHEKIIDNRVFVSILYLRSKP
jgi:hypothetical protein